MPEPDPQPEPVLAKPQRFHGFDALRGGAMLLGIFLHAAITYMVRRMDGLLWPLDDQPTQIGFDLLFWWIHGWRIPLFFVMAGFFAAMLARRRGPGGFISHRIKRILVPVTVATITILPAMYFIWGWGWQIEGRATWHEVWRVKFKLDPFIQDHFLGPAHLWFLNYLVLYSFVYWLILKLRGATAEADEPTLPKPMRTCFTSSLRPLFFALPTFAFLAFDPGFYLAYHHILPETGTRWLYEIGQLSFHAYFFIVGVYLFRLHRDMESLKQNTWVYLVFAHVAFALIAVVCVRTDGFEGMSQMGMGTRVALAAGIALFCWYMIWGMTGLGLTVLAKPRAWVRWLSDSAYWVYLVHLPIVGLLLIVMRDWAIGPWPRFVLIVAVTSVFCLASYQWLVRYTFIGRGLNGKRVRAGSSNHGSVDK